MADNETPGLEGYSPEQLAQIVARHERRKAYAQAYRSNPEVAEKRKARSLARRQRTRKIVLWAKSFMAKNPAAQKDFDAFTPPPPSVVLSDEEEDEDE